jgi:hypothetical protein
MVAVAVAVAPNKVQGLAAEKAGQLTSSYMRQLEEN